MNMTGLDPPIKFIICGGDGTFMRCLLDLMKAGVDVNRNIHVKRSPSHLRAACYLSVLEMTSLELAGGVVNSRCQSSIPFNVLQRK